MNRPAGVTTTALLMGITNAMGWGIIDWQAPHAAIRFVIYTILIVIGYAVIWFYWQGENWARVFVLGLFRHGDPEPDRLEPSQARCHHLVNARDGSRRSRSRIVSNILA